MKRQLFGLGLALSAAAAFAGCNKSNASGGGFPSNYVQILRGQYLVTAVVDCAGCHTSDPTKPFAGGVKFPLDDAGHFVTSRNLTPDADTGMKLTEDEFVRMMQTGEDFTNHGQVLAVMPWPNFRWMTTDDLKAIYAFLKVLPASNNAIPADDKGPFAAIPPIPLPDHYNEGEEDRPLPATTAANPLAPPGSDASVPDPYNAARGAAILPVSYAKMPGFFKRTAAEQEAFGRGSYLVNAAACNDCHTNKGGFPRVFQPGPDLLRIPADSYLTGGATFSVPPPLNAPLRQTRSMGANLIGKSGYFNEPGTSYLSFATIINTMSHADDNPPLHLGWPMPADHFRQLDTDDLMAIYTYMKILAEDYDHTGQADKETQSTARYCTTTADCFPGETCFVDSSPDKSVNNQCVGKACAADAECDACQTCANKICQQPAAGDACIKHGK